MRLLALAALFLAAGFFLDLPLLAWAALLIATLGLAASAAFGGFVLLVLAALLFAATRPPENRR
jgi:hypothetical protein